VDIQVQVALVDIVVKMVKRHFQDIVEQVVIQVRVVILVCQVIVVYRDSVDIREFQAIAVYQG